MDKVINIKNTKIQHDTLPIIISDRCLAGGPITSIEMTKIINIMKNGKAPGWDQIKIENIKYGGDKIITFFT